MNMEYSCVPTRLQGLTYPKLRLNDHTLDEQLASLPFGPKLNLPHSCAVQGVGALDILPIELITEILLQLDIRTLFDFRYVNHWAYELVGFLPQYKAIVIHAPNVLRGILVIGTGRWTTVRTLYTKLCTPECEHCGDFGGYLYLITSRRVCFLCLTQLRLYLPLKIRAAKQEFGLEKARVEKLPLMRVIPGVYSPNEKKAARTVLVDYESASDAGVELLGTVSALPKHISVTPMQNLLVHNIATAQAQGSGSAARRVQLPQTTAPFDAKSGNPLRFVAIVCVPWLNKQLKEVDWGFYCLGCERSSRLPFHWRRQFWAASFDEHIKRCGKTRNGRDE